MTTTATANPDTTDGLPARLVPLPAGSHEVIRPVELVDPNGQSIEPPIDQVYLCRCGRLASKPFCDGAHARTGRTEEA